MKGIVHQKRNNMNILLLSLITIWLVVVSIMYLLTYSMGLVGLNLNFFTAFTNLSMVAALAVTVFGVLAVVVLWAAVNKYYLPTWLMGLFTLSYLFYQWDNDLLLNMFRANLAMVIIGVAAPVYYVVCQRQKRQYHLALY